jgi:AraC-like DNA-binding protein
MNLKFVDILNLISMFQLLLFIVFLLNKRINKNRVSNLFLVAFFTSQFLSISNHFILSQKAFFIEITPHMFFIGTPFPWLWGPLFFFYVKSLLYADFRLRKSDFVHSIPFLLFLFFDVYQFHLQSAEGKAYLIANNRFLTVHLSMLINAFIIVQISVYVLFAFKMYQKYRKTLKNSQSSFDHQQNTWLRIFIFGYLIAFLITDICRVGLYSIRALKDVFVFFSFFGFFVYFIVLFYKAISNPLVLTKIDEVPEPKTNVIPKHEAHFLLGRIKDYMENSEPYLNPELTLKDLSQHLKIQERLLSGVINQYSNQNFYDFVNTYRIQKAKKMLSGKEAKRKSIQQIFYDSGFNSKSTFNLVFKKSTGFTPSDFKKMQQKEVYTSKSSG